MSRLRDFVVDFTRLVELHHDEASLLLHGRELVTQLVAQDDWLAEEYATPDPVYYRQYLLHGDVFQRFSVVSFVWGPGQATPIHDHRTWGLIGMLRGAETATPYHFDGEHHLVAGEPSLLEPGAVEAVSPSIGDIHKVANAYGDRTSISIHVYGADIGAVHRAVFKPDTGEEKLFISGYSNRAVPNLWGER